MCEFKVKKIEGNNSKQISEDIIFFKYDPETGNSRFADILGRPSGSPNSLIMEVNMFESRHDISIIESNIIPFIIKFMYSLNLMEKDPNNIEIKKKLDLNGTELIKAIKAKIDKK